MAQSVQHDHNRSTLNPFFMKQYNNYRACIDACLACASICDHCAMSCTTENDIHMMARCIQLDMECAAICYTVAKLMSLDSDKAGAICNICAAICEACGNECSLHDNEHCRRCADACKVCVEQCKKMAA